MSSVTGVIFINIGTPAAPTADALREYLAEFLGDPYVVDYPKWLWDIILNRVILRTRPAKSARLYASIWQDGGSPLLLTTESIARKVGEQEAGNLTAVGMRYGEPSIKSALQSLKKRNVKHLVVFPLFPQYSSSTTETAIQSVKNILDHEIVFDKVTVVEDYHRETAYIAALTNSIRQKWQEKGKPDKLLFSFHGVPLRYITRKEEPYKQQCETTAELVAGKLGLAKDDYIVSYQSRFGPERWLEPYTDETLALLGAEKCQSLDVICPGFAADCLETLEEIAIQGREVYEEAGGEKFQYIPALNDSVAHIQALVHIIHNSI